jgi:hypothetical protein
VALVLVGTALAASLAGFAAAGPAVAAPSPDAAPSLTPSPAASASPAALQGVVLVPGDLPAGFEVSEDRATSFTALARDLAGSLQASPDARDVLATVLQRSVEGGGEFVTAVVIWPVASADQAAFDATVQQSDRLVREAIGDAFGDATVTIISGMRTGVSRVALAISAPDIGVEYRAVAARRGAVIEVIGHAWTEGVTPVTSLAEVAGILDARVAAAVGAGAPVFRPAGPLVPEITTHIPSPLDVSTDPAVLGTNLVLAALALLLLTVSSKLATRMLDDHEAAIARRVPIVGLIARAEARLGAAVAGRLGGRGGGVLALLGVTLFYGLVFSLLDPAWDPLSVTGLWLLGSLTIANAVVGMADDLVAWRVARRWALPAGLAVRPASALVAMASVGLSRATSIVPGLLFGTPEALRLDESALDEARARRLAVIGVVTMLAVGGTAWGITIVTTGLGRAGELTVLVAGLEALLLLVFASAAQNLFVTLLGLRGSAGEQFRARSPVAWGAALVAVTFVFFHTLLNPQGDPAVALANRNVQVTMGLVVGFSVVVFAAWAILRLGERPLHREPGLTHAAVATAPMPAPDTVVPPPFSAPGQIVPTAPPAPPVAVVSTPMPTALPAPAAVLEASIGTADAAARGRASFRFAGGSVVARVQLVDPGARRQLGAFVILSATGAFTPIAAFAVAGGTPASPELVVGGLLAIAAGWLLAVIGARLWLERYVVTQTVVIPARAIGVTRPGRDWSLGCAFAILLTPLVAILYLLLARGRVLRVTAPFAADRPGPVTLRLKGSEAEARFLDQVLADAHGGRPGS